MAKPIAPTPDFEGEDIIGLLEYMESPETETEKKLKEEMKKQRLVSIF